MIKECIEINCNERVVDFLSYSSKKIQFCPFHFLARKWHPCRMNDEYMNFAFSKILEEDLKTFNETIVRNQYCSFNEILPLGCGLISSIYQWLLFEKLEESYLLMGGMQQPSCPTEPCNMEMEEKLNRECQEKIKNAVNNIAISLGVKMSEENIKDLQEYKQTISQAIIALAKMQNRDYGLLAIRLLSILNEEIGISDYKDHLDLVLDTLDQWDKISSRRIENSNRIHQLQQESEKLFSTETELLQKLRSF